MDNPETSQPALTKIPLSIEQKFLIRDKQLRLTTAQVVHRNASEQLRAADEAYRAALNQIVAETGVDVKTVKLNIETLEFEQVAEPK
jgi:hypothetical protein